jgi:ATP-dependent helicase/nuclease subunit A
MRQPTLFEADDSSREAVDLAPPDQSARDFAVDPAHHVVLEASAGTGKTRVLVDRYVRLIASGVDPRHILAITFTRKAAAEMRERVLAELNHRADTGALPPDRWARIRSRMTRVEIATIDAFCFSLLREFPLEADVDPAFDIADETEMGRFSNEALDLAFRIARPLLGDDEHLKLLFVRVKQPVLREALGTLLDRRHVARPAVDAFVRRHAAAGSTVEVCERFLSRVRGALSSPDTMRALVSDGPHGAVEFVPVAKDLEQLAAIRGDDVARVRTVRTRIERYFLTKDGKPRQKISKPYAATHFLTADARRRHEQALTAVSPNLKVALDGFDADLDVLLARGLQRMLAITIDQYDRLLEEHALLDFAGMLERTVALLEQQEEFARSRLKLQSRYHHLLIDEFQDTSRRQWRLIDLLIAAWAEGEGTADAPTSVFIVGDRKQSIYRFRHAEGTLFDDAARRIGLLRPGVDPRRAITTSFRAVPELLAFVNALSGALRSDATFSDRWRYDALDQFPVPEVSDGARRDGNPVVGIVAQPSMVEAADAVAAEVSRIIGHVTVRDHRRGPRPAEPDDIAILFRARAGHRVFEEALEARGVRTYVYKGLGFFDAPEVQDLQAVIRYFAQPDSPLRAAELLRSRLARVSDGGLAALAASGPGALLDASFDATTAGLSDLDAAGLAELRAHLPRWLSLADRIPPSELIDIVLRESAYATELRGRRLDQARENLKKVRALIRRVENRGYTTLSRLASYFETLRLGDDSNAIVEASGSVNLMTVHASKGLEFPIVFLVNLHMGGKGRPPGVSVIDRGPEGEPVVSFGSTDATRLEEARETEELKRLLYVAVTRARDRLYLAAETDANGQLRRGARSLGGLLPPSLATVFTAAAAAGPDHDAVRWVSDRGAFDFSICRPSSEAVVSGSEGPELVTPRVPEEYRPTGRVVVSTTTAIAADVKRPVPSAEEHGGEERAVGMLVHRLFATRCAAADLADPTSLVERLLTSEERADISDAAAVGTAAIGLYSRFLGDDTLTATLSSGTTIFEVPFSVVLPEKPDECVRGVIDCLVLSPATVKVIEIKTGRPRPEHRGQLDLYQRAVAAIYAEKAVEARLFYPSH